MKLGLPYIVSLRGSDVPFYSKRFEKLDKFIFKRLSRRIWANARAVITNSEGLKDLALRSSASQKIDIIYNGIDTDEFQVKKKYAVGKRLKLIGVGRLIERKGWHDLIRACRGLNAAVTIVGDGPLKKDLVLLARSCKVDLKLLGNVAHDKIPSVYRSHDVFVLPSKNEGMSNTLLEAMACGLPVIVTDVGGSRELVSDNGLIVNKDMTLPQAIVSIKDFKKMGEASRRKALSMSWKKVAAGYRRYYELA